MKAKPKILYLIYSSSKKSGGGHFYSLNSISSCLKDLIDYEILNLGATFAKPLHNNIKATYIGLFKYNLFFKFFTVLKFVKKYNPQIIHAFDQSSLFIARLLAVFFSVKVVFTKCGGQNGSTKIPDADAQIFFSKENLEHYLKYGNKAVPKYLIPNRVNSILVDEQHINEFKKSYNLEDKFVLLRISRFNSYYDLTFMQSIELMKAYKAKRDNVVLLLIGKIQSVEYFQKIKSLVKDLPIIIITEDKYTNEASRLLNVADVVIATGRGVMEASSLNKIIYCPNRNSKLPVLLNDSSLDDLRKMNFSERAVLNNKLNTEFNGTKKYFESYFSVESVKDKYMKIYVGVEKQPVHFFNLIIQTLQFFKPKL